MSKSEETSYCRYETLKRNLEQIIDLANQCCGTTSEPAEIKELAKECIRQSYAAKIYAEQAINYIELVRDHIDRLK